MKRFYYPEVLDAVSKNTGKKVTRMQVSYFYTKTQRRVRRDKDGYRIVFTEKDIEMISRYFSNTRRK